MAKSKKSRREFIKNMAAGAATAGFARSLPASGSARAAGVEVSPNERVILAVMGTNSRGTDLARSLARLSGAEVAWVCDVDTRAATKAARAVQEISGQSPKEEKDFRRILDDSSVDALVVAAPDHWHAPATILACAAGKHVYVEKPCSHNPREGELMVEAARKYKRVVQMGSQRRSRTKVMEAIHEIQQGRIGRVYYSRSWYANTRGSIGSGKPATTPDWLDYELWQGPAPHRDFRDNLIHYNWHWFWHWGTGEAGNNGVHSIDLSRWGLGVDYPSRVTSSGGRYQWQDDQETPDTQVITFDFEGGRSITWEGLSCNGYGMGGSGFGVTFHGTEGTLKIAGSDCVVYDRKGEVISKVSDESESDYDAPHLNNFLDAIRTGARLNAPIEEGHKSTLLCHLGNIAWRHGQVLNCDSKNGHIRGDKKAARLWSREYRPGWEPKV